MSKLRSILSALEEFNKFFKDEELAKEISTLERDLLLSKLRALYETIYLSPRNIPAEQMEKGDAIEPSEAQERTEQEKQDEMLEIEDEGPEKKPAGDKSKTPAEKDPEKQDKTNKGPEILAEKYQNKTHYINESIGASQKKEDLSSKLKSKPIEDIGSALGVNDRFHLIRELFNGDREMFDKTIAYLNNAPNFNDAFSYIQNTFDWDMESEAVQNILDLVRRKFILHQ